MTEEREFNSASFYKFLGEKQLMASRCTKCQTLYLPPHPICTKCYGSEMEWVELRGNGKLAAFTAIAVGPSYTLEEGYSRNNPYVVGVVELEEGPKISSRIKGLDARKPESIKVGTPLSIDFQEQEEGKNCYLAFKTR